MTKQRYGIYTPLPTHALWQARAYKFQKNGLSDIFCGEAFFEQVSNLRNAFFAQ
jgi:hypothetical protein